MTWCRVSNKPLYEPVINKSNIYMYMYICITMFNRKGVGIVSNIWCNLMACKLDGQVKLLIHNRILPRITIPFAISTSNAMELKPIQNISLFLIPYPLFWPCPGNIFQIYWQLPQETPGNKTFEKICVTITIYVKCGLNRDKSFEVFQVLHMILGYGGFERKRGSVVMWFMVVISHEKSFRITVTLYDEATSLVASHRKFSGAFIAQIHSYVLQYSHFI